MPTVDPQALLEILRQVQMPKQEVPGIEPMQPEIQGLHPGYVQAGNANAALSQLGIPEREPLAVAKEISPGRRALMALVDALDTYGAGIGGGQRQDFLGQLEDLRQQQADSLNQDSNVRFQDELQRVLFERGEQEKLRQEGRGDVRLDAERTREDAQETRGRMDRNKELANRREQEVEDQFIGLSMNAGLYGVDIESFRESGDIEGAAQAVGNAKRIAMEKASSLDQDMFSRQSTQQITQQASDILNGGPGESPLEVRLEGIPQKARGAEIAALRREFRHLMAAGELTSSGIGSMERLYAEFEQIVAPFEKTQPVKVKQATPFTLSPTSVADLSIVGNVLAGKAGSFLSGAGAAVGDAASAIGAVPGRIGSAIDEAGVRLEERRDERRRKLSGQ